MKRFSTSLIVCLLIGLLLLTSAAFAGNQIRLVVNGQEIYGDVPPQMVNDRVMVPVRFVSEALGAGVVWSKNDNSVYIATKEISKTPEPKETFTPVEPPQITGPDNFVKVIQGALNLCKRNDPVVHAWITSNLKEIKYEINPAAGYETAGAYINKETKTCYAVANFFKDVMSGSTVEETSLLYLGILAHETAHVRLKEADFEYVLNDDDEEVVSNLAGLRAMEKAGGTNSDKPVCFFEEIIKKDLKL